MEVVTMSNVSDKMIRERDGNQCARCGDARDLHVHHRMLRSAGHDERACNRVTLCHECHHWAHMHPADALEQGWLVGRYHDAVLVPLNHWLWPAGPVLLTDDDAGIAICT